MAQDTDYIKSICNVIRAFGTATNKQELLDLIVEKAVDTMKGKAAALFLADPKKDIFLPAANKGLTGECLQVSLEKEGALVTDLVKKGHLAIHDDTASEQIKLHDEIKAQGIRSALAVPVMVQDSTLGMLFLYTAEKKEYTENELIYYNEGSKPVFEEPEYAWTDFKDDDSKGETKFTTTNMNGNIMFFRPYIPLGINFRITNREQSFFNDVYLFSEMKPGIEFQFVGKEKTYINPYIGAAMLGFTYTW